MGNYFETSNLTNLIELAAKNIKIVHKFSGSFDLSIFNKIKGLSNESIDILNRHKPETIRQASLMPGFTSSAVFLLLYHIKNKKTKLA